MIFELKLPELWLWEGPKPKLGKCPKWICSCKTIFYFLALFCKSNSKIVLKNYLTILPWFLAFKNCPWSSEYDKIHGSDSKFKVLIQNEDLQFSDLVTFWDKDKIFILLLKPWIVSYSKNQGQFWKPQNLRKRINIKLIVILLFHWVKIEIQKRKVTAVSVLWVIWDTFPPIFGQKCFKMAFGLVDLKSPWNDSSKTPLDCSFLITRIQFRDFSNKLF